MADLGRIPKSAVRIRFDFLVMGSMIDVAAIYDGAGELGLSSVSLFKSSMIRHVSLTTVLLLGQSLSHGPSRSWMRKLDQPAMHILQKMRNQTYFVNSTRCWLPHNWQM